MRKESNWTAEALQISEHKLNNYRGNFCKFILTTSIAKTKQTCMSSNVCLSLTANSSINTDNCKSQQYLLIAQQLQQQPNLLQEVVMKAIFTTKYLQKN